MSFLHPEAPPAKEIPESKELTAEDIMKAVEYLKKQSDEYWADPASKTCGIGFPHVISPSVYKNGGWTLCGNCGMPLEVEPHGE